MNTTAFLGLGSLVGLVMIASVGALTQDQDPHGPPDIPTEPHLQPLHLLHAQRFDLDKAYTHWWRAERPRVSSGWLLVLSADPDLVYARQVREPVLYVGNQTAERVNVGYESGRIVAIVPADVFLTEALNFLRDPSTPRRSRRFAHREGSSSSSRRQRDPSDDR